MELPRINFEFEVGIKEKHTIVFDFQLPLVIIAVDEKVIIKDSIMMNPVNIFPYKFKVGESELHDINIFLKRQWQGMNHPAEFFCEVYVDGEFLMKY